MKDIPLSDFKAYLKFYRPSFANPLGEFIMKEVFPVFNPSEELFGSEMWQKIEEANERRHGNVQVGIEKEIGLKEGVLRRRTMRVEGTLRRRFAGDYTHPRSSYYSICNDELGNDYGTLKQELSAYLLSESNDQIVIHDLLMPRDFELLNQNCKAPTGFAIELIHSDKRPNPIILKMWKEKLILELPNTSMMIFMPLEVKRVEISRVFDLRQLETQEWLVKFLPDGNDILNMPNANKLPYFCDMLPSLMYPERGGNDITDSIGFLLRQSDVNGLVFPSARCNVKCEFLNGKLNDFYGWNFLDYGESGKIRFDKRNDYSQWNKLDDLGKGIVFYFEKDNTQYQYSWRISGLEENMQETISDLLPGQNEFVTSIS